jgi:methyltransferase
MEVSLPQVVVGAVLLVRLVEFWVSRRNAEARLEAGEEEIAGDLHLATAMFHALWLAALAFLTEREPPVDPTWLGAGALLVGLRGWRLFRAPAGWSVRLFRGAPPPADSERASRLLRDPSYIPMFAELLVIPLIFGLWWFALLGTAAYVALAWQRLAAEGLR